MIKRSIAALAILALLAACGGGGGGGTDNKPVATALSTPSLSTVAIGNGSATFGVSVGGTSIPATAFGDYKIGCVAGGSTVNSSSAPAATVKVTGLANDTQYTCRLTATSKDANYLDSAPSEPIGVTPIALASSDSAIVLTGQFIDAPVSGLTFSTRTQAGSTDASGNFRYLQGEVVKFAIGGQQIGAAVGKTLVHVSDIVAQGFTAPTPSTTVQIAQVLQSLNTTPTAPALITINPLASTWLAGGGLPIGSVPSSFATAFTSLVPSNVVLVSEAAATQHINSYLSTVASSYEAACGVPRQTFKIDSIYDGSKTVIDASQPQFNCNARSQIAAYKNQVQSQLNDAVAVLNAQASIFDQTVENEQKLIDQTGISTAVRQLGYAVDTLNTAAKLEKAQTTMQSAKAIINGSLTLVDRYVQQPEFGKNDKEALKTRVKLAQAIVSTMTTFVDCTSGKNNVACSKAIISAMTLVEPPMALAITDNDDAKLALQNLGAALKLADELVDAKGSPDALRGALLKYAAEFLRIQGTLLVNVNLPEGSNWRALLDDGLDATSASVAAYFDCYAVANGDVSKLSKCYDGVVVRGVDNFSKAFFRAGMLWTLVGNRDEMASVWLTDAVLREYLAAGADMENVFANRSIPAVNLTLRCLVVIGCSSDGVLSEKARFALLLDQLKGKGTWDNTIPVNLTWSLFTRTLHALRATADFYERKGGFSVTAERTTGSLSVNILVSASSAQVDSVTCTAEGATPSSFSVTSGTPKTQALTYSKTGAYRVACLGYKGVSAIFSQSLAVSLADCSAGETLRFGNCVRPAVTGITPTSAIAGIATKFTVTGTNLPLTAVLTIAEGTCATPTGNTTTGFTVSCTPGPATGSKVVTISSAASGGEVIDRSKSVVVSPASTLATSFLDNFDGATINSTYWTVTSSSPVTLANGMATTSCGSQINSKGKVTFSGGTIIVEGRFAGQTASFRDTAIWLVDVDTGDGIAIGDTDYGNTPGYISRPGLFGLYTAGSGRYDLPQSGNGNSVRTFKEYRLTLSSTTLTAERGDSLSSITESVSRTLPASIHGRKFYLLLGHNMQFCPGTFDWIRVTTAQ